jgi:hypothetical protein
VVVKADVQNALYIRRSFQVPFLQDRDPAPAEAGEHHSHLQHEVLAGARLSLIGSLRAGVSDVIWG